MPHIHDKENQHDFTASAFIVRTDFDEPRLMLHEHKKVGLFMQAGGHVELEENLWQAISHELLEETGYDLSQLQILQPKQFRIKHLSNSVVHPVPIVQNTHLYMPGVSTHKHIDTVYGFITDQAPAKKPNEDESQNIIWVTLAELKAFDPLKITANAKEIGEAMLNIFIKEWEALPLSDFETMKSGRRI